MKYILDGQKFTDKEAAYNHIKEVFDFPDYFGDNLDALWDELSFKEGLFIKVKNSREIVKNLGDYGIKLLDIFGDLDKVERNLIVIEW